MEWFAGADRRRDGVITLDEFVRFYIEMCTTRRQTFFFARGSHPHAAAGPYSPGLGGRPGRY
jgi:hypothetical protein